MRSKKTKACPLASRIKRMMQKDDDVGKIASASPILIARATELFLQQLCERAAVVAKSRNAKTVSVSHLKSCVASVDTLDFLQETVRSAPDLGPADEEADKPKRRRPAATEHEEGQSTPKPRARSRSTASAAAALEDDSAKGGSPTVPPDAFGGAGEMGAYGDASATAFGSDATCHDAVDDGGEGAGSAFARSANPVSLRPSQSLGFSRRAAGLKQPAGTGQQDGAKRPRKVAKRATAGDGAGVKEEESANLPAEASVQVEAATALELAAADEAGPMAVMPSAAAMLAGGLQAGLVGGLVPAALAQYGMQANNDYDDDYDA